MRLCVLALALSLGCEAGSSDTPDAATEARTTPSCATASFEAVPSPSVLLFMLQRSGSMSQNDKWAFAAQAITSALDLPLFDTMAVGLLAAPSKSVQGPACAGFFEVACGVPAFAQIPPRVAGANRSTDMIGVRRDLKDWLAANAPDTTLGDGDPLYGAIQAGTVMLQSLDVSASRLLFVVTDGQVSCTSLSSRKAFKDINGCLDWEDPNNIIDLVSAANTDARAPVETFIVGVPGADTYDPSGKAAPPYRMRAALSSIAKAGAPTFVPAGCNATIPFDIGDPDPQTTCHFDMSKSESYSAAALAGAVERVRATARQCIYQLPKQKPIDPAKVNVSYSMSGTSVALFRRAHRSDPCEQGCWDYTVSNDVQILGAACDAAAKGAKVEVVVGCATEVR